MKKSCIDNSGFVYFWIVMCYRFWCPALFGKVLLWGLLQVCLGVALVLSLQRFKNPCLSYACCFGVIVFAHIVFWMMSRRNFMRRGGLPPGVNSFSQVVWPWGTAYGRIAPDTYILRNREGGDWLKERGVWRPLTEVKPDAGLRFPDDSQLYGFLNWRCIGDVGEIASGNDPCRAAPVRGLKLRILKIVLLLAVWVFLLWLHFSGAESRILQAMGL